MEKNRMQKLAGIKEGLVLNNGKFKLERYTDYSEFDEAIEDYWCLADDVDELEELANQMYDILNELVEDYYVHSDVDLKIVAQEARQVIKKAKSL